MILGLNFWIPAIYLFITIMTGYLFIITGKRPGYVGFDTNAQDSSEEDLNSYRTFGLTQYEEPPIFIEQIELKGVNHMENSENDEEFDEEEMESNSHTRIEENKSNRASDFQM